LEVDRRCFAFFHPALIDDPIIFVEVALSKGLTSDLGSLLDIQAPLLAPEKADAAIFYSINNCLHGLRGVPFGSFLIKQVVVELAAEFPNIKTYSTLSPLPQFSRALRDKQNEQGFTQNRLSQLLDEYASKLTTAAGHRDPIKALFRLLEKPLAHRDILAAPLERLALAYLTKVQKNKKIYDPVAVFHLSNGARLERVNAFGNVRPYGLEASFGLTVNYKYILVELEENHEQFVRNGKIRVSDDLLPQQKIVDAAWQESAKINKIA
jgi:malonyl-CoA decarboxylase